MRNRNRRAYRNKSDLNPESGAKPKKMKKRELENKKEKFRKSREWKEFRSKMANLFNHRDYITGKRLVKGFNVHHLKTELTEESYCDISNESEFMPLNSWCHKMLHYIFPHYVKDPTVIDRLVEVLDKMKELSNGTPPFDETLIDNEEIEDENEDEGVEVNTPSPEVP